jgi:hypothetical protein
VLGAYRLYMIDLQTRRERRKDAETLRPSRDDTTAELLDRDLHHEVDVARTPHD